MIYNIYNNFYNPIYSILGLLVKQNLQNECIFIHKRDYYNSLQSVVQLVRKWLSTTARSMNSVVVQSMGLEVCSVHETVGLSWS